MQAGQCRGFSLFETLVAMFVMLVGLLGIFSVFGSGMHARLMAQELVISQELATQWADWIRFRLNDTKPSGSGPGYMNLSQLSAGKSGNFYSGVGDFHYGAGDPRELPTVGKSAYKGYSWTITQCDSKYTPQYLSADGTASIAWTQRSDGGSVVPAAMGSPPENLLSLELTIYRGARSYKFGFMFSGVGLKYER